jgi:sulfoxide reductase heme-binding subunit YedZ
MASPLRQFGRAWLKPVAFWLLFAPFAWIAWQWIALLAGWSNAMGFNPEEYTHRYLGDTAIRVLLVALAVTPVRDITGWAPIMTIRRRIGLFAFAYALLHIAFYLGITLRLSLPALWEDVVERKYITFGMLAFLGLIPLAITSHNAMIRRLGAVRWRRLHWLVYPIAILAVTHHAFMVKVNQAGPWAHGIILAALLGWRIAKRIGLVRPRARARAKPAPGAEPAA